jgi:septum formation protein
MRLLLASASPRRADLLRSAGISFDVIPADVDERPLDNEAPEAYVERLARAKAAAAAPSLPAPDVFVLAADTAVVVDGEIFGKPGDGADAARMLRRLSGRAHDVLTGVAVLAHGTLHSFVDRTRVWMRRLADHEIDWYIESGEPVGKAGAYAIQGLASRFIVRIDGSSATVVGLPVSRVYGLLVELGAPL